MSIKLEYYRKDMHAPPTWHRRSWSINTCAALFLAILFVLGRASWQEILLRLLTDGMAAVGWAISAAAMGYVLLRWLKCDGVLKAVTAFGVGIGVESTAILLLGLAGLLNRYSAIIICFGGLAIALVWLVRRRKQIDLEAWSKQPAPWQWLWILAMPILAFAVLAAFFPPGILWGQNEPNGYDVLEYHLQVPREWFEAGKIIPLHHNVFSYFPMLVESHFLLAMHVNGGPWAGMYLAQLMHLTMCIAVVMAVYALAGRGWGGVLAGLAVCATPWIPMLGSIAYNEGAGLLFVTLAVGWACMANCQLPIAELTPTPTRSLAVAESAHFPRSTRGGDKQSTGRGEREGKSGEILLAGILGGFACCAKYTNVPIVFIVIPLAMLIVRPSFKTLGYGLLGVLGALVVFSPWLIRNWIWTGNPVFPEVMNLLGRAHFSPVQVERWRRAYWPDPKYAGFDGHLKAVWEQILSDWRFGFAILPLGFVAMMFHRTGQTAMLALVIVGITGIWLGTHLQGRFYVLVVPLAAIALGRLPRLITRILTVLVIVACSLGIARLDDEIGSMLFRDASLMHHGGPGLIGYEHLIDFYPPFSLSPTRTLPMNLVGDAKAFWFTMPPGKIHYKTVFDVDTSDPSKDVYEAWLAGMPNDTFVVIDREELDRFHRTYYGMPKLPGEY